jgi:hypothetical protein
MAREPKSLEEFIADSLKPATALERKEERTADFNAFMEGFFSQMGKLPSLDRLKVEFPERTVKQLEADIKIAAIKLHAKGYNVAQREYLSAEQLAVANALLNLSDRRSRTKKLQDFGVSPAVFNNWKRDPVFNAYLREQSEKILPDSISEVHLALVDSATAGDIQAIKLFYEITGRHTPNSQQTVNVQMMLVHVIEAVQRHVHDPEILRQIASEIQEASGGVIQGELVNDKT